MSAWNAHKTKSCERDCWYCNDALTSGTPTIGWAKRIDGSPVMFVPGSGRKYKSSKKKNRIHR